MKAAALLAIALLAGLALAGCGTPPPADDGAEDDASSDGRSASSTTGVAKAGAKSGTKSGTGTSRPTSSTATGTATSTGTATATSTSATTTVAPATPAGKVVPAQVASTRVWGDPAGKDIRPGMDTSQAGSVCTANFLYHLNDTRYFIGLAAHCFQTGSNPVAEDCPTDNSPLGTSVTLTAPDGDTYGAKLAYSSFLTMRERSERNPDICAGNDFALAEIDPRHIDNAHPAVRFYGGPTAVLDSGALSPGDAVHGYGNSDLRSGYETVPTAVTNPHDGEFLEYDYNGWEVVTRMLPPTIQGDSGSGLMGPGGEATGVLSSGSITYTEEQYTNIAFALRYMQDKLGWAPSVVTWSEFSPDGIEDP